MDAIVIAFTLKGQNVSDIVKKIQKIGETHPNHILIHGFMPRKVVEAKGWSTEILDAFDKYFPIQLNMYNEKPLRAEMASVANTFRANVLVIGEEVEGVAEEVKLYKGWLLNVYYHKIENPTPLPQSNTPV